MGGVFTRAVGRPVGTVVSVTPGEQVTGRIAGVVMSYVIVADGIGTRLLLKLVFARPGVISRAVAIGDWPMARRQLLRFTELAERGR